MATPIEIKNVIIQYPFLTRPNPVSKKYGYSALIPYDQNCPVCQSIINASAAEWNKVAAGATKAQSMGYTIIAPNDAAHIHESVMPMLDPSRYYLQLRAGQDGDAETLIPVYDSVPQLIPNGGIVGNGTIANIKVAAFGYNTAGQKGVKYYAQWLQIVSLVENLNAATGPGAIDAGGYVADAAVLTAAPAVAQAVVTQAQQAPEQQYNAVMPGAQSQAPVATIPSAMPGAPMAPVATPVQQYAAPAPMAPVATPVQQYADPAAMAPAATMPAAPVPGMTMAPAATMPAAGAAVNTVAPAATMPAAGAAVNTVAPAATMPAASTMPTGMPGMPQ
jgi:hypothetical protein